MEYGRNMNRALVWVAFALAACASPIHASDGAPRTSQAGGGVVFYHDFNDQALHTYTPVDLERIWHTKNAGGLVRGPVKIVNDPHAGGSHGKVMQVFFAGGRYGYDRSGSQWPMDLGDHDDLYCAFDVYFEPGFDFRKGGKLPSPRSTDWISKVKVGHKPDGTDFWTAGIAWGFHGELIGYAYHVNQPNRYGHGFSWDDGTDKKKTYFTPGRWHTVEVRAKVNTPGKLDGAMQGWFDGEKRLDRTDLLWRMPGGEHLHVGQYLFYTSFGGADKSFAPAGDQHVYFDNFVISTRPITHAAPPRAVRGGVRSALYPDNWRPGYRDAQGRFLQDYSYAGYHNGEKPLPTGNHSRLFDVTAPPYGADKTGKQHSGAAIQKAIDDAQAAGAGIVYLPAGLYSVTNGLRVKQSRIVLRGAGSHGPDATRLHFVDGGRHKPNILFGANCEYGARQALSQDARIFDHHVTLTDVGGLAPGDYIFIGCRITDAFLADHHMSEFWGVNQKNKDRRFFRRRITRIEPAAGRVFFKVPIRYPLLTRDDAFVMKTDLAVTECGIEHLAVCNATKDEKKAWDTRPGWQAIQFVNAADCWIRDVRSFESPDCPPFHLRSFGVNIRHSKQVTITDCHLARAQNRAGGGNGYLFNLAASNEILFKDCTGRHGRHNFNTCWAFGNSGNVFLRIQTSDAMGFMRYSRRMAVMRGERKRGKPWASDYHMALAIANLVDNSIIDDAWSCRNRGNMSAHSGHTATQCVFWNNRGKGYLRSYQYGWGYVIGTEGLDVRTTAKQARDSSGCRGDDGTEPYDFTEHINAGAPLTPASLYEDQLARRLNGRMP